MNSTTARLRYMQVLVIGLLGASLYMMTQSLSGGTSQFESNLWNREFLVSSFIRLKLKLGDRVFSQALVGKEGWLEYTGAGNLDGYQNTAEFPPGILESMQQRIQKLSKELRKRNITLILVIPPNKATIYPDKLPDQIQKLRPQSKLDEFAAYLQQHGPPVLLDLRPALREGRKQQDIYYKTDTHWNPYGIFIAYTEIMKELAKTYPQLTPKSIKEFKIKPGQPSLRDIPQIIGATNQLEPKIEVSLRKNVGVSSLIFNDDKIPLKISTMPKEDLPILLMYRDSFGIGMEDFISAHFHKAIFIQNSSKYPEAISLTAIDIIKPNIVIVEIVERSFNNHFLDQFLIQILSRQK